MDTCSSEFTKAMPRGHDHGIFVIAHVEKVLLIALIWRRYFDVGVTQRLWGRGTSEPGLLRAVRVQPTRTSRTHMASTAEDSATEPRNALLFKEWLVSHGGSFHPGVRYSSAGTSGLSIVASEAIEPDATIVSCPFSIIITPHLCKTALLPILDASVLEHWTERQSIVVYICFHWIASTEM